MSDKKCTAEKKAEMENVLTQVGAAQGGGCFTEGGVWWSPEAAALFCAWRCSEVFTPEIVSNTENVTG